MRRARYFVLSLALAISMILSNGFNAYAEESPVPLDEPLPPEASVLQEETIIMSEESLPLEEPISPLEEPILAVEEALVPMGKQLPPAEPITPPEELITPLEELITPLEEPLPLFEEPLPAVEVTPLPPSEHIIIYRNMVLSAEVKPDSDTWINGETITYSILLTNDGTEPLSGVSVHDDWGISVYLSLQPGETQTIEGEYEVELYNKYEVLGNSIEINVDFEGVSQSIDLGFNVNVKIPRGSITIINNSEPGMFISEFDFLIDGPNGTKYSISLEPGEKGSIEGLYIGDYSLSTIAPMNYQEIIGSGRVKLTLNHLDEEFVAEYRVKNEAWFTDQSMSVISDTSTTLRVIAIEDIDMSVSEDRSESVYLELEPIIVIPEIILNPPPEDLNTPLETPTQLSEGITPDEQELIPEEPTTEEPKTLPPYEPEPSSQEELVVPKEPEIPEQIDKVEVEV